MSPLTVPVAVWFGVARSPVIITQLSHTGSTMSVEYSSVQASVWDVRLAPLRSLLLDAP